jgi:selenocysteine-specific elongation factor
MAKQTAHRDILPVTLGTAGHIDHGKTTLLRALAGAEQDTDRLAEERERGLTIDVGYAELELDDGVEVGVVDVPGHEKFIRNMVAGATGIDVVMLVVAADDGVMPQTREHLQIMSLLGLRSGVIVLTKADTVDEEMVELVASEVEDLVQGTFLEGAKTFPVSGITGQGIDALRTEISSLVRAAPPRDAQGFFRMPVLRVFTSPGFGTVVTGIPTSGHLAIGDRVAVRPGDRAGRVRGLQVYHRPADEAAAGHRTAINLAELEHRKVRRGDVVCTPGVFSDAALLDVKLHVLASVPRALKHNTEVRLHVGTLECAARVLFVDKKRLDPGMTGWARLKLDRDAVIAPGDRFIIRTSSHVATLGGGVILGSGSYGSRRRRGGGAGDFEERECGLEDLRVAVESHVRRARLAGTSREAIVRTLLRRKEEIEPELAALTAEGAVVEIGRGILVHGDEARRGVESILAAVERFHEKQPLAIGMKKALLPDLVRGEPAVVDGLVSTLLTDGRMDALSEGRVRLGGRAPRLSTAQQSRSDAILEILGREPWQTPRSNDLPQMVGGLAAEVEQLLTLLEHAGRVVRLRDGVLLLDETFADVQDKIRAHCAAKGSLSPADVKALVGATRKYAIPLLEHLDQIGFTRRQGDVRVLRDA